MRVVIIAAGTWGDVRPNGVVAQALQEAGYEVLLVAAEPFQQWVQARGVPFSGLSVNIQAILDLLVSSDSGFIATVRTLRTINRLFAPATMQMGKEIASVIREGDALLMIESGLGLLNGIVERNKTRLIHINMQPFVPTSEFPGMGLPVLPGWMPMRKAYNRMSYDVVRRGGWSMMGQRGNQLRADYLSLAKQTWTKHRAMLDSTPSLLLVSRHVVPQPSDWAAQHCVTGYVFDDDNTWKAPEDLLNFLAEGEKPVYIGFGSMRVKKPEATTRLVLEAVRRSGKRTVLLSGWAGMSMSDLPKNVFLLNYAPHRWLFPQTAAVIHHGGAGTTAAGLAAGVPTIVVPILADQPFWARRVYELGVGTKPIPHAKLTVDELAAAIDEATSNRALQDKAAELGKKIMAEDGLAETVKAIRQFLA
jgi:UDP:flavonoid glycosyltransferase YjiC (YdhE family)